MKQKYRHLLTAVATTSYTVIEVKQWLWDYDSIAAVYDHLWTVALWGCEI